MESLLESKGVKKTLQRIEILKIIENKGHISIDDIYLELKSTVSSSISLATIYKNISFMVDKDILKKVLFKNDKELYEIVKGEHYHIIENGEIQDVFYNEKDIAKIKSLLSISPDKKLDLTFY